MIRNYPASFHQDSSDRSSRSSSTSSDITHKADNVYDFNAPMQTPNYHQSHGAGYDDMVFPERKMY